VAGTKPRGGASRRTPPNKRAPSAKAQAARRAREARALRTRLIIGGILIVAAGAVVFAAARPGGGPSVSEQLETGAGQCAYDTRSDGDRSNQGDHVPSPTYEVDPPAGGPHLATAAEPGFYQPGEAPPDGQLVHAQEHGFVVLWYRSDLPEAKMTELAQLSDTYGRELILVPRQSLPGEVAVTAWHRRLVCGELVSAKVGLFTRSFVNEGPEKGFL